MCKRCDTKNSLDSKFCNKCGFLLEYETAIKMNEIRTKADKLMSELIKNPEVLDALLVGIEKIKERNL